MLRILEHPTAIPRPISMILAYPALDFNFTSWMSPTNLRVLRTEQSETHIPGIVHGKDHMRHKSPLSVVDDVEKKPRKAPSGRFRQKSWGEAISSKLPSLAITPGLDQPAGSGTRSQPVSPGGWTKSLPRTMSTKIVGWLAPDHDDRTDLTVEEAMTGSSSDSEDEEDEVDIKVKPDSRRDADKSLQDRVKTPREEKKLELTPMTISPQPTGEHSEADPKPVKKRKKAPIGTRMTMTSRVGYFQDRVISPSMVSNPSTAGTLADTLQMRAMAILYIGPRRNPDFETDYYISPILSPPHLLAHFPPVYLICGECDPFVDDTVIFAGKVREAKRGRRAQAEGIAQSKSAKFGEGLRMSSSGKIDSPDHILRETDDDWVQIRIIEGWGHGFMQMASLMREVDSVLTEMADWIDESFEKAALRSQDVEDVAAAHAAATAAFRPDAPVMLSPEGHLMPPRSTHVKPVRDYKKSPSDRPLGGADLGAPVSSDLKSDEEEGVLTFTPKTRKKNPPPSKFTPVPRRPSRESLKLQRNSSAPRFDLDETGSSGEAMTIRTPPLGAKALPSPEPIPKGSGAFAFFNGSRSAATGTVKPAYAMSTANSSSLYGGSTTRRTSGGASATAKPTNSLIAAAVAGARAASPALVAAGLVNPSVGNVSEAELMRRRRMDAVFGMGETDSAMVSDEEDQDDGA